ncbi:hypothetical protein [Acinetobacter chinensis]|uniref:hypothetical protein n=1 Tax=Acinetobacter chinensis TaxID=2004650 RepID=UPI0029351A12|nr:hypothetical protein [Acinetobacter chinensis]WOE42067.1 hypothetical protein QSG87_02660 [Acinetobacter chinensis]
MINKSTEVPDELKDEFKRTQNIVDSFIWWLSFCMSDTARDSNFTKNHLLSFLFQDILETLFSVKLNVIEGIHAPSIRESRYILELSIKVALIQTENYSSSIEEKLNQFNREIKEPSISPMKRINLQYLKEDTKVALLEEVGRLYGQVSSFVHVTPKSIEYRQNRMNKGRVLGRESAEDIANLNNLLERIYAASLVFLSHSVPQYVIGDWHVPSDGELIKWYYMKSKYLSEIDSNFDYKHERQEVLERVTMERHNNISF